MLDDAHYAAAEAAARQAQDARALAHALRHRSDIARTLGDRRLALSYAREAVSLYRRLQPECELDLANALRLAALAQSDDAPPGDAKTLWREARALYLKLGVPAGIAECDAWLGG